MVTLSFSFFASGKWKENLYKVFLLQTRKFTVSQESKTVTFITKKKNK